MTVLEKPGFGGEQKLWYMQPAEKWEEALPVGNGRLGAMIFGGLYRERIQLNENSIWSGYARGRMVSPLEGELLRQKRDLLFKGKYTEAENLTLSDIKNMRKKPLPESVMVKGLTDNASVYETLGNLYLDFGVSNDLETGYRRELDLNTAIATTTYKVNDAVYTREVFCSYPAQVVVVRISCNKKNKISFNAMLQRPVDILANDEPWSWAHSRLKNEKSPQAIPVKIETVGKDGLKMDGQATGNGAKFECLLKVITEGGKIKTKSQRVYVDGADAVTLLLSAVTNYHKGENWQDDGKKYIEATSKKAYEKLKEAHIADYQRFFNRVDIDLGSTFNASLPTDERLRALQLDVIDPRGAKGLVDRDPSLFALYFQFGRYLTISTSRPGALPPGLMFWNPSLFPYAFGTYYTDINIEMNYWPTEVANLSELHTPLFDLSESFLERSKAISTLCLWNKGSCFSWIDNMGPENIFRGMAGVGGLAGTSFLGALCFYPG